ncbi:MAG: AbrB/MazE/SpoVT family DNA-binding domain-containing protein [Actinobacteria bacterium]|jgi:AbrB family looped-hinge helix DNA binding protein|nr:AbrB/MazE/SpoVT family DNA-binding domain-containing protein [Actinomycetota bacterium]
MRTTIDAAGRVVIPKPLRDELGIHPGEVELVRDGAGVRIEPVTSDSLVEEKGRTVIPPTGTPINAELVQALRDAGQR